jgi:predicted transglutaminase-like cysteine proteinase
LKAIFLVFTILLSINSFAYEFKLNEKDKQIINNSNQKSFILKRLEKYQEVKKEVKKLGIDKKLAQINFFINGTLGEFDNMSIGMDDYWMTPKEFFIKGHGDCEDYAIAKYFTLIELGVKKEHLYFAVVGIKGSATAHMVLFYVKDKKSSPLVLDNLSFRVLPLSKRTDLTPKYAFNEIDSYLFSSEKFKTKIRLTWGKEDKWGNLLNRVYKLDE